MATAMVEAKAGNCAFVAHCEGRETGGPKSWCWSFFHIPWSVFLGKRRLGRDARCFKALAAAVVAGQKQARSSSELGNRQSGQGANREQTNEAVNGGRPDEKQEKAGQGRAVQA